MTYKATTQIKYGSKEEGYQYLNDGDDVNEDDFSEDELEQLKESGAVVESDDYEEPEENEGPTDQAAGTPSNLEQITGTGLAADETGQGDSDAEEGDGSEPEEPDEE